MKPIHALAAIKSCSRLSGVHSTSPRWLSLAFASSFTADPLVPSQHQHSHPHTPTASSGALAGPGIVHTHSHHPTQTPMPTARTTHPRMTRSAASQDIDNFPEMSGDARPASRPAPPLCTGSRMLEGRAPLVTPTSLTSSKHRSCVYSLVPPRYQILLLFNARSTSLLYPRGGSQGHYTSLISVN